MVPSREGPLTVPYSLPLELIPKSPHPTPQPPSSSLLLAPCVKPIVDLDLNRHKYLAMAWGPDALIVLMSQAFQRGQVSGTKWEFRRSVEYIQLLNMGLVAGSMLVALHILFNPFNNSLR